MWVIDKPNHLLFLEGSKIGPNVVFCQAPASDTLDKSIGRVYSLPLDAVYQEKDD